MNYLVKELDSAWTELAALLTDYRGSWRKPGGKEKFDKCKAAQQRFDKALAAIQKHRETALTI